MSWFFVFCVALLVAVIGDRRADYSDDTLFWLKADGVFMCILYLIDLFSKGA